MSAQVLVAYASQYGGTAEIAEKIGQVLRQAGLSADVLPARRVNSLTAYQAVVLGSAVYIGQWRKEAVKFLQTHEKTLMERKLWVFSSGPTGEGDPIELQKGWIFPTGQRAILERLQPCGITVFHGVVDVKKLNPLYKWMIGKVGAPVGDFRDWDRITSWAEGIAKELT
jgi:menaquinone-dependent protoporphyrinogen oxidase